MLIADWQLSPSVIMEYSFEFPESMSVSEEYIIMNTLSMIASIGGTMGIFTGLSFFDIVPALISFFEYLRNKANKSSK